MEWGAERPIDLSRLLDRMLWYGQQHGVDAETLHAIGDIVKSPAMEYLIGLPEGEWFDVLVNDFYKASMHSMYAASMRGVTAAFALHVRRTPVSLHELAARHPQLMQQLQLRVEQLADVQPYSPAVQRALEVHAPQLQLTQEMVGRAELHGVAHPVWSYQCSCASPSSNPGPGQSGSHKASTSNNPATRGGDISPDGASGAAGDPQQHRHMLLSPESSCDSLDRLADVPHQDHQQHQHQHQQHDHVLLSPDSSCDGLDQLASRPDQVVHSRARQAGKQHGVRAADNGDALVISTAADEPARPMPDSSTAAATTAATAAAAAGSTGASADAAQALDATAFLAQVSTECATGEVAPWVNRRDNDCACIAAGAVEAASHTETSVMQLVQEAVICAQVLDIRAQHAQQDAAGSSTGVAGSCWPDRTELLASSLAHLAHVVDQLNSQPHNMGISLFAGRRSSDRLFLVVQNLAFSQLVRGYQGTSSIYAAAMLNKAWDALGLEEEARQQQLGPLVGTHAHEMSSIMQQLMAHVDQAAGQAACAQDGAAHPVPLSSLLAHLLFLTASGDLAHATALPDTFGTPGWLAVALAADVPPAFAAHMQAVHGQVVPPGAKCFDLFRVWRIDSGKYEQVADMVMTAWEQRCQALTAAAAEHRAEGPAAAAASSAAAPAAGGSQGDAAGQQGAGCVTLLPRPVLMHSNLGSVEEVLQVAQLPPRIRPNVAAFGSLADGFFPLCPPPAADGPAARASDGPVATAAAAASSAAGGAAGQLAGLPIRMASVVMKAVQARAPKLDVTQLSAVKAGDLSDYSVTAGTTTAAPPPHPTGEKVEMDPRLDPAARAHLQQLVASMRPSPPQPLDERAVSQALAEAYHMVAVDALLQA